MTAPMSTGPGWGGRSKEASQAARRASRQPASVRDGPEASSAARKGAGAAWIGQVGHVDLAEFRVGGVDVDEVCAGFGTVGDGVGVGRHLAEADADGEDQVGLGQGLLHGGSMPTPASPA
jgi:hypothetical protein